MSKTETKTTKKSTSAAPAAEAHGPSTTTRIDPAHTMDNAPADSEGNIAEATLEQVRLQAAQLSDRLAERQRQLDRRESEVNAQVADLENQSRRAQLWLERRREEIEDRQRQLDEQREALGRQVSQSVKETKQPTTIKASLKNREKQLREDEKESKSREKQLLIREQQTDKTQAELDRREQQLDTRSVELSNGEMQLAAARLALDEEDRQTNAGLQQQKEQLAAQLEQLRERERHAAAQLVDERLKIEKQSADEKSKSADAQQQLLKDQEQAAGVLAKRHTLFEVAARLDVRQQQLEAAESLLEKERDTLVVQRRELTGLRDDVDAQARAAQEQLAQRRTELEAQWEEKRRGLDRRVEMLQLREKAIDRLRIDIGGTHRETLEMRVAIEEIWSQLSATMKPAALTQSLAGARSQLSDYYRLANAEMAERKEELQQLSHDLALQHKQLATNKTEMQQWVARRQEEIELQAARLVGREQKLDRQESQCEQLRRTWQQERLCLQQQLRSRLAELRRAEPAVA